MIDNEDTRHSGVAWYKYGSGDEQEWSREEWDTRRSMVADIWGKVDEYERKELLSVLIAHAPEACS